MERVIAQFDGYTLREVSFDRDILQLSDWMSEDPYHRHLRPAFFLGLIEDQKGYVVRADPRPTCYALEDSRGEIFYIRIDRAARVNIQFKPLDPAEDGAAQARARVANALMKGMAGIELGLQIAQVSEWVFDSQSETLRMMAKTRLGFRDSPFDLVRPIQLFEPQKPQERPPEAHETPSGEVN